MKNKTVKLVIAPNRVGYIFLEGEFLGRIGIISASSLSRMLRRRLPERDAEKYAKFCGNSGKDTDSKRRSPYSLKLEQQKHVAPVFGFYLPQLLNETQNFALLALHFPVILQKAVHLLGKVVLGVGCISTLTLITFQ